MNYKFNFNLNNYLLAINFFNRIKRINNQIINQIKNKLQNKNKIKKINNLTNN